MKLTLTDKDGVILNAWPVVEDYPDDEEDIDMNTIYVSELISDRHNREGVCVVLTEDVTNEIVNNWQNGRR